MGIDIPSLQFLACAKSIGVDFSDTLMVGRQRMSAPTAAIASILSDIVTPREQIPAILEGQFAEPLLTLLGAEQVSSADASDWERATYIHDFNQPLPAYLANRFSIVLDGGTIEHVFNIPQAFKNCMEMVRIGGHFIQVNVANNYMGHGFWQFCPELIYRIFSPDNGFQIKTVLMFEPNKMLRDGASSGAWYKVDDPAAHHCRIDLINHRPTYICTIAQRVEERSIFERFPQQSDYAEAWKQAQNPTPQFRPASAIGKMIPLPVKKLIRWGRAAVKKISRSFDRPYYRSYSRRFDAPYFHRISDNDVVRGRI